MKMLSLLWLLLPCLVQAQWRLESSTDAAPLGHGATFVIKTVSGPAKAELKLVFFEEKNCQIRVVANPDRKAARPLDDIARSEKALAVCNGGSFNVGGDLGPRNRQRNPHQSIPRGSRLGWGVDGSAGQGVPDSGKRVSGQGQHHRLCPMQSLAGKPSPDCRRAAARPGHAPSSHLHHDRWGGALGHGDLQQCRTARTRPDSSHPRHHHGDEGPARSEPRRWPFERPVVPKRRWSRTLRKLAAMRRSASSSSSRISS